MCRIKSKVTFVAAVMTLASASVYASAEFIPHMEGNVENGKKIFMEGKQIVPHAVTPGETVPAQAAEAQAGIEVPACTTCHGEKGMGDDNMGTPRLAGQGYNFIVKQLTDFATDKRMDTTMGVMNNNAKGLSAEERRDVAAYVSSLTVGETSAQGSNLDEVKAAGVVPVGQTYLGKSIAVYGAPERGIPACHSCHGFNARGAFPVYPMLSGQRYVYLVNQLKKWREESRTNDMMGQMRAVAKKMSDDDIYNVASYLTGADRTTVGNTRMPVQRH